MWPVATIDNTGLDLIQIFILLSPPPAFPGNTQKIQPSLLSLPVLLLNTYPAYETPTGICKIYTRDETSYKLS